MHMGRSSGVRRKVSLSEFNGAVCSELFGVSCLAWISLPGLSEEFQKLVSNCTQLVDKGDLGTQLVETLLRTSRPHPIAKR
jgi:hypothetical protein